MAVERTRDYEPKKTLNDNVAPKDKKAATLDAIRWLILVSDIAMAIGFWIFREELIGQSDMTNMIAAIVAAGLVMAGLTAFFVLKLASIRRQ